MRLAIGVLVLVALASVRVERSSSATTDFDVSLTETQPLGSGQIAPPQTTLSVLSTTYYHCDQYFPTNLQISGSDISLNISTRATRPGNVACIPEPGPIGFDQAIDIADGEYQLNITYNGAIDSYHISKTVQTLDLTPLSTSFSDAKTSRFYRFPTNSFAYYCGGLLFDNAMCDRFGDELLAALPVTEIFAPGDGEWPYATSINGNYYDAPPRYFVYPADNTWEAAKGLLKNYVLGLDHVCGRTLWLVNWESDRELSWLYRPVTEAACEGVTIPTPTAAAASPSPSPTSPSPAQLPETGGLPPTSDDWSLLPISLSILTISSIGVLLGVRRRPS